MLRSIHMDTVFFRCFCVSGSIQEFLSIRLGNQVGREGNIEIKELLLSDTERIRELIDECVQSAGESGCFVLCPPAGYNKYPFLHRKVYSKSVVLPVIWQNLPWTGVCVFIASLALRFRW